MIELSFKQIQSGGSEFILQGDLDELGADKFCKCVNEMPKADRSLLILDCSGLKYVSSAGIGSVIAMQRELQEDGGRVLLAGTNGPVFELLEMMNLHTILELYPDMEQARQASGTTQEG